MISMDGWLIVAPTTKTAAINNSSDTIPALMVTFLFNSFNFDSEEKSILKGFCENFAKFALNRFFHRNRMG